MASTNQVQIARTIQSVARKFYQSGITPDLHQILANVSEYFAKNPPGLPISMDVATITNENVSNVDDINTLLANLYYNLAVLYDTSILQTNEILLEDLILTTRINQIQKRQQRLLTDIKDYMFSLYNTGGYYFSISDNFADTSRIDLNLTTAFVDITNHEVTIPLLGSGFSSIVPNGLIGSPTILATDSTGTAVNYTTINPFSFAVSGTTNTLWQIQVALPSPDSVSVELIVPFVLGGGAKVDLSRIDFDPYSMIPFQLYTQTGTTTNSAANTLTYTTFGNNIITSPTRMSFTGTATDVQAVKFTMNKAANSFDFQDSSNGTLQYIYIFGAKDITFTQQVYDNDATLVSTPLSMLSSSSNIIDSIALEATSVIPSNTTINYFVAVDNPNAQAIGDFNWQPINPTTPNTNTNIVKFNGAYTNSVDIRSTPRSSTDLQLIPLNNTSADLSQLNPNPLIIPGANTYTFAKFSDSFLPNSISLEEGINSTRIYYLVQSNLPETTDFWSNVINNNNPSVPSLAYGEIDTGNGFFYGGILASDPSVKANSNGISLFVETYLYLDGSIAPILDTLNKVDTASRTWDVQVYLNGSLLANLPGRNLNTSNKNLIPLDSNLLTWDFQQGINHIALIITIPAPSFVATTIPTPYLGTLDLMANNPLYDLGTVKLSNWSYVSFFDLQYNQPGTPTSFTIYNNQIISKHPPTTNYRLNYSQQSGLGPDAIRFRADLSRSASNDTLTPQLDSYSIRFLYGS